ncbi:hypothetical protein SAMN05216319_1744 [Duganella sp. CF402]|uniref:ABC transporter permease n=1 Tax=unclassified Duganella TaxID=2636909 RepID=UPI0008B3FC9D|nr:MULTISPECIES: hypothetical protein [unclassified Duganella]RZT09813.1 hypothetical protein EV582_1884 [Duganella sp. BK701]SEL41791.1 hypothetical protein SAMN05216319_1744 [Duganella sp. CF402]
MNAAITALLLTEVRLRMRRPGTLVAVLALIVLTWLMVGDPAKGHAMIVSDNARVTYNSSCLAIGSAALTGLFFGLIGFYLTRGRMNEDIRTGVGAVLAATPSGSGVFVFGRWLGNVAYLCGLLLIFLVTMLVLHLLRGEGPMQLAVYLQTYALVLLPLVFFTASIVLLFESWPPLMGKGGDVLYFVLWTMQLSAGAIATANHKSWSPALLLDFSGIGIVIAQVSAVLPSSGLVIGGGDFDASLAPRTLPNLLWTAPIVWTRIASALIALLPLLPALLLFHRFSPDRVKVRAGQGGWSPLALLNRVLRPCARIARPLLPLAARLPGVGGHVLALLALVLLTNPAAIVAALALLVLGCAIDGPQLGAVVIGAIVVWGILISEISVRDAQYDVDAMTAALPGGRLRSYAAQWLASCLLALLLTAPVLLRWLAHAPLRAAALLCGVAALSAAAGVLGGLSRTARTFLALFLFGMYVATQAVTIPALDVAGFNGAATIASVTGYLVAAGLLLLLGRLLALRQSR